MSTPFEEDKRPPGAPGSGADHSAGRRRRWSPLLLSLLVFPGLGQIVTGRRWRGLAYAGASAALLVAVVRRVYTETSRLLPTEPDALLDPALPFRLAAEIHRANAAFFIWATAGIVALWALSALDVWASERGTPPAPGAPRRGP